MPEKTVRKDSLLYILCEIGHGWSTLGYKELPATVSSCAFWAYVAFGAVASGLIGLLVVSWYLAAQILLISFGIGYFGKEKKEDTLPLYFHRFIPLWGSGEGGFMITWRNVPLWPIATMVVLVFALMFPLLWYVLAGLLLIVIVPVAGVLAVIVLSCAYHNGRDSLCHKVHFIETPKGSP